MYHDRVLSLVVLVDVGEIEVQRHLEIKLNRTALPCASDTVFQVEIDLRTVESAVALVDRIGQIHLV